jgi:hypothetical protein
MCFTGEIEGDRTSLVSMVEHHQIRPGGGRSEARLGREAQPRSALRWPFTIRRPLQHTPGLTNYRGRDIRCVGRAIGYSSVGHDIGFAWAPNLPLHSLMARTKGGAAAAQAPVRSASPSENGCGVARHTCSCTDQKRGGSSFRFSSDVGSLRQFVRSRGW